MIIIDKHTRKLLRYIMRKDTPTANAIIDKFKLEGDIILIILCRDGYLICKKNDGICTDFNDGNLNSAWDYKYWATPKARKLLEDRFEEYFKWGVTLGISIAALVLSVVSIFIK